MQGFEQVLIVFFLAFLVNASNPSNGVDIGWKDPGETVRSRQTRDAPSHLSSIRDKLLNVTRFANGLALAESVALGNISFGRIVTELMVADQFSPGSDWVNTLAAASGPELDEILSEIGSFEGFLEGNTTVDFSEYRLSDLVRTILQGKEIPLMKHQIESMQKIIDGLQIKAESFDKLKGIMLDDKLNSTLKIVPLLTLLPDAIQSYSKLSKNKRSINHVSDGFDSIFSVVENNQTDDLLIRIKAFKQGFAKFQNNRKDPGSATSPALMLRKLIFKYTSILNLTTFDEIFIKDVSKIVLLLSFTEADIENLGTLQRVTANLTDFQKTLDDLKFNHTEVSSSNTLDSADTFSGYLEKLQPISDTLEVLKPGSELISLAKKFSNKSLAFNDLPATPTLLSSNFLKQSKFLQSFDGLQSYIASVKLASSKELYANWEDLILLERNISSQLESVQIWLSEVKHVKVVKNGVKSIKWMLENEKTLYHFEEKQVELSSLVESVNKMVKIEQANEGFRKFSQLLIWLSNVPNWKENLLAIRRKAGKTDKEEGMMIFHISETISFLKQTLQFFTDDVITKDMVIAAKNFTNLDTIENSLNYIVNYRNKGEIQSDSSFLMVNRVNSALSSTANWVDVPVVESISGSNNEVIEKSCRLISDFKNGLVAVENKKQLLDEVHKDMGELEGLVKTYNLMSEEELTKFEEGLNQVKLYRSNELAPPSNVNSAGFTRIFQSGSDDISLLDSLVNNLRAYSDLIFGFDSVRYVIKLSNEILDDQGVPDEVKVYLKKFQDWLEGADNLKILSDVQIELKFMSLLNKTPSIKENLQNLIDWLSDVPKDAEPSRVRRSTSQSSLMNGNPQEGNYVKLKHLIDKAQDPKTTEAIKQLGADLTRLAGIFGIEEEIVTTARIPTCQEDPSSLLCTATNPPANVNSANNQTNIAWRMTKKSGFGPLPLRTSIEISILFLTLLLLCGVLIFCHLRRMNQMNRPNVQFLVIGVILVLLAVVNPIEGGEPVASMCNLCANNECPKAKLDGKSLNRCLDRSVCKEKNRVMLTFSGKPLYINAQYITIPDGRKFIATQEALPNTVDHFLEMLIQQKSKVVCQLYDLNNDPVYLQKSETDLFSITKKNLKEGFKGISCSEVTLKRKTDNEKYVFTHIRNSQWRSDILRNFEETVDMLEYAKKIAGDSIIVVHCQDGLDRTMTFIGIEYDYQRHTKSSSFIDKLTILSELRKMRFGAISKQPQFYFMYYGILRLWQKNKKICKPDLSELNEQYLNALKRYEEDKLAHEVKMENEKETAFALVQTIMPAYCTFEIAYLELFKESFKTRDRLNEMKCSGCSAGKEICENGTDPSLNRNPKLGVCGETNRVPLIFNEKPQYINAQFVAAPNTVFIATQGPTHKSVDHFLEMIIQHDVKVICMLCKHMEPDAKNQNKMVNVCVDYVKLNEGAGEEAVKSSLYTVARKAVDCKLKGVVQTELTITRLKDKKKHVVTHFWITEWPDHKVPNLPLETVKLLRMAKTRAEAKPIVVHCSEGIGRTVSFIGIQLVFGKMNRMYGYPDRFSLIEELQSKRLGALPDVQQLYFMFFGVFCMWKMDDEIYEHLERIYFNTIDRIKEKENEEKSAEGEKSKEDKSKKEKSKKDVPQN